MARYERIEDLSNSKMFLSFQGITDAIKPKLKFDQAGIGHNK